jgi:protein involved in polysaccharide export with SLBB domain
MRTFRILAPIALLAGLAACGGGQPPAMPSPLAADTLAPRPEATRAELQHELDSLQAKDPTSPVVATIEKRLTDGDIQAGDRVYLNVEGEQALSDTFTVRAGQSLLLPGIPDPVSLHGVLRSELDRYLAQQLGQYVKSPRVDAVALIRLSVTGAVGKPGFYTLPAATLASEVIMAAGGPDKDAKLKKTTVQRGDVEVANPDVVQAAFRQGVSVDQMNLHSGDQFVVPQKSGGFLTVLQYVGAVSGLVWLAIRVSGH